MRWALRSGSNRVQRALPSAFAQYSVVSAACIRPVGEVPAAALSTTPIDAETESRWPARSNGCWSAARTERASSASSSVPAESSTRIANSSPPRRATSRLPPGPREASFSAQSVSREATAASSRSPVRCPRVSLMALKPSRSR